MEYRDTVEVKLLSSEIPCDHQSKRIVMTIMIMFPDWSNVWSETKSIAIADRHDGCLRYRLNRESIKN